MDRITEGTAVDTTVSRPVTEPSRITGTRRVEQPLAAPVHMGTEVKTLDWHAVVASVVSGLAITTMLLILGVSTGLIAGNEGTSADEAQGILGAIGVWVVVAMCIGSFVGSLLGGRLARWLDRGSLGYHALTSWGLATLMTVVLASLVSIGFATTTNSAANTVAAVDTATEGQATEGAAGAAAAVDADGAPDGQTGKNATPAEETADQTADVLGGAGVALTFAMILTLVTSAIGWWIGSRKRLLDIEREPVDEVAVA